MGRIKEKRKRKKGDEDMTISIENWEKVTEIISRLKNKPYEIEVYEGYDYLRVDFYFRDYFREIKEELET